MSGPILSVPCIIETMTRLVKLTKAGYRIKERFGSRTNLGLCFAQFAKR
ncbi:hypothetical protein PSAB6_10001 [Paraburkholderia sabiae]|nr:hypothetical protein PSAB6_10001 [Paraburkholderia sabiae]